MSQYAINGSIFTIQPTSGRWLPRTNFGFTGNGHQVYAGFRDFEIEWQLVDATSIAQLQAFFDANSGTGTSVVKLPEYANDPYQFFDYSGCVVQEPEVNRYFTEHVTRVRLLVSRIAT